MTDWHSITQHISQASGQAFRPQPPKSIAGGCINQSYCLSDGKQHYFIKLNHTQRLDMFAAEAEGLAEINASDCIPVPKVICYGTTQQHAYLVLTWFGSNAGNAQTSARFGEQLACLHRQYKPKFGWHRDNTIGATPQNNTWHTDWVTFWQQQRLGYQLKLAAKNGYHGKLQSQGQRLLEQLPALFSNYQPRPSLLHGDLWSGNYAINAHKQAIIFDPAVYYGDRETDIAMTELFGTFPADFYAAYNQHYALDIGYTSRKILYNLYHILNHLNLFGGGYRTQSLSMIEQLLAQL